MVGLVALVVVGLAVIVYGALSDRAKNRRRAAAMLAPPERSIPGFEPSGRGPAYVSELQARRRPGSPSTSSGDVATGSGSPSTSSGNVTTSSGNVTTGSEDATVEVRAGWASRDFTTDAGRQQAVLEGPRVLVCADPVQTVRELLPVLERALPNRTPLVLVAPEVAPEVLATLEVNVIQGKLALLVVPADDDQRASICAVSGATPVDRSDRQSGFVSAERLGQVARWTSTREASYLVEIR